MDEPGRVVELRPSDLRKKSPGDRWPTDYDLFQKFHGEFEFTIDVAADDTNARLPRYFTEKEDGLKQSWKGERVWCNPPYSNILPWMAKASMREADVAVFMLPVRTGVPWWHLYVWDDANSRPYPGVEIRFAKGRVRFYGANQSPSWDTVVVIFRPVDGGGSS